MRTQEEILQLDKTFFSALMRAETGVLDSILAEDFSLADLGGGLMSKASLTQAVGSGKLRFEAIKPVEAAVRFYGRTAIVTGRTEMHGNFEQTPFAVQSRYTHVYVEQEGKLYFAAAQGTPIALPTE